jgi:hypothetical protein
VNVVVNVVNVVMITSSLRPNSAAGSEVICFRGLSVVDSLRDTVLEGVSSSLSFTSSSD